jgi:hypothetical protein
LWAHNRKKRKPRKSRHPREVRSSAGRAGIPLRKTGSRQRPRAAPLRAGRSRRVPSEIHGPRHRCACCGGLCVACRSIPRARSMVVGMGEGVLEQYHVLASALLMTPRPCFYGACPFQHPRSPVNAQRLADWRHTNARNPISSADSVCGSHLEPSLLPGRKTFRRILHEGPRARQRSIPRPPWHSVVKATTDGVSRNRATARGSRGRRRPPQDHLVGERTLPDREWSHEKWHGRQNNRC